MEEENEDLELTNDKTEEEEYQYIDPNDIIIIDDPENWKPPKYIIEAYAHLLGYNPLEDPKELLDVAEKYLTVELPDNIKRAFTKDIYQILYLDVNTQEITLESEREKNAKQEFEEIRKKFKEKKEENLLKNYLPNNNFKKTDEELMKKIEEQKKYNNSLRNSVESNIMVKEDFIDNDEDKKDEKKTPIKEKKFDEINNNKNDIK